MVSAESEDEAADAKFAAKCKQLQMYYTVVGREEWWWVMDDSIEAIGAQLQKQGYCILDGFLTNQQVRQLRQEVGACHAEGRLSGGGLVNGRLPSADDAKYADRATRGDVIGWFDPEEWHHGPGLESYLVKLGTLIQELGRPVPDLKKVTSRSKAMAACYPGGGARYVRHVDNDENHPLCRTRLLTALIYLNDQWRKGDGGELAIFQSEDPSVLRRQVAPLQNRLLLFWSDRRTPHEVLPSEVPRYSVTVWLLDNTKKVDLAHPAAQSMAPAGYAEPDLGVPQVRYSWRSEAGAWSLEVQLPPSAPEECPLLDISDTQLRLSAADAEGTALLCVPVPGGCAVPKWSRKKRLLTVKFDGVSSIPGPATDALFAEQIASKGWGTVDGFLPGPLADELRSFVLEQKALGKLSYGKNKHEGPVNMDGTGRKSPMKNDEYTFLDSGENNMPALRELTQRCNQLLAKLMVTDRLKKLKGRNLWQGHPMLAVYPGNGAAYGRHLDSTVGGRGANGRVLTLVLYLNPFWQSSHGGCLRLLDQLADETGPEIEPLHGRLLGFLCEDQNPHEVLPCWSERVAVTIWYYDADVLSERCEGEIKGVFEGG